MLYPALWEVTMLKMLGMVPVAALLLSACGSANAVTYDPADDVHCHALSLYFTRVELKKINTGQSPDIGAMGILVMGEWYREKFGQEQARIGEAEAFKRVNPLYRAIGADFEASKQAYIGCKDRAASDPAFEGFARTTLTKMSDANYWNSLAR